MKTISLIVLILTANIVCVSGASSADNESTANINIPKFSINLMLLPYADSSYVEMVQVASRDEYSLWKCPANNVSNKPTEFAIGTSYNYFVYKNDKFHLTVTEFNKDDVYKFFTDQL